MDNLPPGALETGDVQNAASPMGAEAQWRREGDRFTLQLKAARTREAFSPALICVALGFGLLSAVIAVLAGATIPGAALTGALLAAICLIFVGYLRLSSQARELLFSIAPGGLTIVDHGSPPIALGYDDVISLMIVHDGAPSKITVASAQGKFSWTIGQLYRHNRVERFVPELPAETRQWLEAAHLRDDSTTSRGVRRTHYRRQSRSSSLEDVASPWAAESARSLAEE